MTMAIPWLYLVGIVIALLVCGITTFVICILRTQKKYSHIPGPPPDGLILGNIATAKKYRQQGKFFGDMILDWCQLYGNTLKMRFLNQVYIFTADPQAIRELLITGNHPKSDVAYSVVHDMFWERFLGKSLFSETDQKQWVWRRALVNPCFQKSYLKGLETAFNTQADTLMNRVAEMADGKTKVVMLDEFLHLTLDTIGQLAFGLDMDDLESKEMSKDCNKAIDITLRGMSESLRNPLFKFNITQWRFIQDVRKALRFLRNFSKKCFMERMAAIQNGDYTPDDILNHLVKIKLENPEMDEEVIMDDITSFFIAGTETSASLLGFVMINLWKNKDVLERLRKEVLDVVGVKSFIGNEDLKEMTYLDMVIKETLRINPPAPNTFRQTSHDMEISGYKIPVGTSIGMSTFVSSRLEEFFPDPLKFDPERFNPNTENKIPSYTYFPFSLGPRTCIGKNFAENEVKIILAKIMQRFNYEMDPNQSFGIDDTTTLRPKGGAVCMFTLLNTLD